jgi:ABC-2 type transport system permease protein
MSARRTVLEVARWEFLRFFKLKDQVLTFVIVLAVGIGIWAVGKIAEKSLARRATIAVVAPADFRIDLPPGSRLVLARRSDAERANLRREVEERSLDGLLIVSSADSATLRVAKNVPWESELETAFQAASKEARLRTMGLSREDEARISRPGAWSVDHGSPGERERRRAAGIWSAVFVGLTLLGLYMGSAFLLIAITGEKRLRVTEQVVSAITPQTWIDGKILGLSGVACATTVNLAVAIVVTGMITAFLDSLTSGGRAAIEVASASGEVVDVSLWMVDPWFLLIAVVFAVLGFFFWFTLFAAVASTIDDPNTSSRNIFLFAPMIPASISFLGLRDPDGPLMRVLALLPFSSPAALPVRVAVGEPALWEGILSFALLVGSIALFRRAAGKVFGLGMLLYGKEPRWSEVWRWVREA